MSQPTEEWRNEGTAEGCQYFLLTFIGYGCMGLGFIVGLVVFIMALVNKVNFWLTLLISLAIWGVFSLVGLVVFWRRDQIKPPNSPNQTQQQ
jgi:hypothetical protein